MSNSFDYVAMDRSGQRVRGAVDAESLASAHARLQRDGLSPLRLVAAPRREGPAGRARTRLGARDLASFLHDLGALASAGVDLRSALGVLGRSDAARTPSGRLAVALERQIAAGSSVEAAFVTALGSRSQAVAALVAAGEASGNLGLALSRGAESLDEDLKAAEQLVAAVSYPAFIVVMTAAALAAILLFVVPTLAPLLGQSKTALPLGLRLLFGLSAFLLAHGVVLLAAMVAAAGLVVLGWRWGFVRRPLESWLLDGPAASMVRGLVFGRGVALLGLLVAARAPTVPAMQTVQRSFAMRLARERMQAAIGRVRDGASLSTALDGCLGVPKSIVRLAAIGEEVGSLGPMLERAGRLEARKSLQRIDQLARWLGPALIVALGALIGLIMASLLSSITALGDVTTSS